MLLRKLTILLSLICALTGIAACKSHKHRKHAAVVVPTEEKRFVIVIPSYNNSAYCENNLRSVLSQDYETFRVIYIDDCSTDDTYEKVAAYLAASPKAERVALIRNEANRGALANLYHAIHSCDDREIIVTVDGDDFLAHPYVLAKLNAAYASSDVWMTYGNYLDYPRYKQKPLICKKIPKRIIEKHAYRSFEWVSSHLRTFYAGLFKQIKLEDLQYQGGFLTMGWDLAFMMPMLEMSGPHALFIRDVLYLYNRTNPINDHKVNFPFQQECANHIRSLPPYLRLEEPPLFIR